MKLQNKNNQGNISIISLSLLYEIFKIFPLLDTYYYEHVLCIYINKISNSLQIKYIN